MRDIKEKGEKKCHDTLYKFEKRKEKLYSKVSIHKGEKSYKVETKKNIQINQLFIACQFRCR